MKLSTKKQIKDFKKILEKKELQFDFNNSIYIDYEFVKFDSPYLATIKTQNFTSTYFFEKDWVSFKEKYSFKLNNTKFICFSNFLFLLKNLKIHENQFFISWSMADCKVTETHFVKLPWLNLKSLAKSDVSKHFIHKKKKYLKQDGFGKIKNNHKLEVYEKIYGIKREDKGKAIFSTSKRKLDKILKLDKVTKQDVQLFKKTLENLASYNRNDVESIYQIALNIQQRI